MKVMRMEAALTEMKEGAKKCNSAISVLKSVFS